MRTTKPKLVYILSASHSGSTLTAMILNSHPDLCSVGELKATNIGDTSAYRCSCQSFIQDCEFWRKIESEMSSYELRFRVGVTNTSLKHLNSKYVQRLLAPLHRGKVLEYIRDGLLGLSPVWRHGLKKWRGRNLAMLGAICKVSGARQVVDSSKIGIRLKYLIRSGLFDIKVVRLIRDGRAVALTYMNPDKFADAKDPGRRGGGARAVVHEQLLMQDAATEWRRSNEEAEHILKTMPKDNQISIRYEDLCTNTQEVLRKVHVFLGVESDESYVQFKSAAHHVIGNGMRLDGSSKIVLDERWRVALTEKDLMTFESVAGPTNRRYGYE